jgi:hypothetical protein
MLKKIKKKLVILLILVVAYFFSNFLNKNLFIANSPKINSFFLSKISQNFLAQLERLKTINTNKNPKEKEENKVIIGYEKNGKGRAENILKNTVLKTLTKGVYAGSYNGIQIVSFAQDEMEWEKMTIQTKSGVVTIKYPKNNPPLKEVIELIKNRD